MSKIKFLTTLVVLLLLLNAVTLFFLIGKKDGNRQRPQVTGRPYSDYITKKLQLDTVQQQELKLLRDKHKQELEQLRKEDKQVQDAKMQLIKNGVTDSATVDSILTLSAMVKKKYEITFHNHFMQIRALCKPEQLPLFYQTLDEMNKRRMQGFGDRKGSPKKTENKK